MKRINKDKSWKILIVDDEQEIHDVTKLILKNFIFDEKGLDFISAYSAQEAKEILSKQDDIAIVLLDVIMESNNAGLDVIKYIREELHNFLVRIILRTGYPGQAPKEKVIREYDINDYKEKSELTVDKLDITMYASLRNYQNLKIIEEYREKLELKVIEKSDSIKKNAILFNTIFQASRDGIFLVEKNTRLITAANPAAVSMYGYSSVKEIVGKRISEIIIKDKENDCSGSENSIDAIIIERHHRKNGKIFTVEFSEEHIRYNNRQYYCFIIRDISIYKNNLQKQTEYLDKISSFVTEVKKLAILNLKNGGFDEYGKSIREYNVSKQEENTIFYLYQGLSNKEIGEKLFIHEYTVKKHVSAVYRKLNISKRSKLIDFIRKNNIKLELRF